jgi:hypothetical protein
MSTGDDLKKTTMQVFFAKKYIFRVNNVLSFEFLYDKHFSKKKYILKR